MQIVSTLADLNLPAPAYLTIGAFDGVHRGHQALIGGMVQAAHAANHTAVVVTFYPHPSVVLRGRRPSFYLSTQEAKAGHLAALGVDALVVQPFTAEFALVTAAEYVAQLRHHARLTQLWCGADFALGHQRQGDVAFLRALGVQVQVVEPTLFDGEIISSTRIRQCLRDGAVEQAHRYLGRPFAIQGEVQPGAQRGRTLGFPTANVSVNEACAIPAFGVYACRAHTAHGTFAAVTNIGVRPTFEGTPQPTIEAHLLDFSGNLYGHTLRLDFVAHLRPEQKFPGLEALVAQIRRDVASARSILQEA